MLASEIKGWYYFISWDNASPPDSSAILVALAALGAVSHLTTKTSVALAPRSGVTWRDVRVAIRENLNPENGKAFYVNLRTGKCFQIGSLTNWHWRSAP